MYEQIIGFMDTSTFMYLMVVWAIMLPAFFYAFYRHWEIMALNGFVGELIRVIYLLISSYEIIGVEFIMIAIASALK